MGVLLSLDVHPDDMGKIIGRSGNTAKAIRILLRVVGMKNNARVNLKINEPEGGRKSSSSSDSSQMKSVDDVMEDLKL
jgi:predicted RNA-binding protein Jag